MRMTDRAPSHPLAEPLIIAKFWRNRSGEAVYVTLREFKGRDLIDLRVFAGDAKGLSLTIARLPELATAINRALNRARELELIERER
jgi:hypothetical protein